MNTTRGIYSTAGFIGGSLMAIFLLRRADNDVDRYTLFGMGIGVLSTVALCAVNPKLVLKY